jgi:hypothetical protein
MMKSQALQYYMHDEPDAFRFELAGSLSGEGAQSVFQAWRTALSIIGGRPLIVDMTYVDDADERGRSLILFWHQHGARIIAASARSGALAGSILGESLPEPPAKPVRLPRLRAFFRGRAPAAAVIPARAEQPDTDSASTRDKDAEFTAVSGSHRLACRLP